MDKSMLSKFGLNLLLISVLSYLLVYNFAGICILFFMLLSLLLYGRRNIECKAFGFLLVYSMIFWGIVICGIVNSELLEDGRLSVMLINFMVVVITYYILSSNMFSSGINGEPESKKISNLILLVYYILLVFVLYHLLEYGAFNIDYWDERKTHPLFPYGMHQVDFSVIVIDVFLLGMKRGYTKSAIIMAGVATLILPVRTWRMFVVLYILCRVFKKKIYAVLKIIRVNYFIFLLLLIVAAYIFVLLFFYMVPPDIIVDSHEGLLDTSNYGRVYGILYGYQLLIEKELFFVGVPVGTSEFLNLITTDFSNDQYLTMPHNSYIKMMCEYSIVYTLLFFVCLSKIIERLNCERLIPYVIPYMICGLVLHDMFSGVRLVFFLAVIILPFLGRVKTEGALQR